MEPKFEPDPAGDEARAIVLAGADSSEASVTMCPSAGVEESEDGKGWEDLETSL